MKKQEYTLILMPTKEVSCLYQHTQTKTLLFSVEKPKDKMMKPILLMLLSNAPVKEKYRSGGEYITKSTNKLIDGKPFTVIDDPYPGSKVRVAVSIRDNRDWGKRMTKEIFDYAKEIIASNLYTISCYTIPFSQQMQIVEYYNSNGQTLPDVDAKQWIARSRCHIEISIAKVGKTKPVEILTTIDRKAEKLFEITSQSVYLCEVKENFPPFWHIKNEYDLDGNGTLALCSITDGIEMAMDIAIKKLTKLKSKEWMDYHRI